MTVCHETLPEILHNQAKVLLLPFIRGEGWDEGLLVGVQVHRSQSASQHLAWRVNLAFEAWAFFTSP